jgi:hypothetical protein
MRRVRRNVWLVGCSLGLFFVAWLVVTCAPAGTTTPAPPVVTATPLPVAERPTVTSAPPLLPPAASSTPSLTASTAVTRELKATVVAGMLPTPTPDPAGGDGWGAMDVAVLALDVPAGSPPLWAAYSVGMASYDPVQQHFVAIYTHDGEGWQPLARLVLTDCAEIVDRGSLVQVPLEPGRIWLELQSYAGVHSGCYDLMSFDGAALRVEAASFSSSPGAGHVADVNGDGTLEVVFDWTEYYVFCYACGVRLPMFGILRWDGERLVPVQLATLPETAPADVRELNDRAVALAGAELWKEAQATMAQVGTAAVQDAELRSILAWNRVLIDLNAGARAEEARSGVYPLLQNAFYGDYAAAVDVMRPYDPDQIWTLDTPLLVGTPAEGWEGDLGYWISMTTNLALDVEPDLAPALFLRGWARFLLDEADPAIAADVSRAAALDPGDALYAGSLDYLQSWLPLPAASPGPSPLPATTASPPPAPTPTAPPPPTPKPTTAPRPTAKPTAPPVAGETWQVRTLLAGPGEPGRLYALLTEISSGAHPAERVRFLVSDDYGGTWLPFSGGLPAPECVRNVNLDYATPDALYASTCHGLYRWTGGGWTLVSGQETGMVAVVYGRPETMWATGIFVSGPAVLRSDDGGGTWRQADSGLIQFNGVANLGIDPRDANTLYAVIWPKYAGSYLRRGTAGGQWQTMPTPRDNAQIDVGLTIDGSTGVLYVTAFSADGSLGGDWQLWRTLNPATPEVKDVRWEMVHDYGPDFSWATLLASGWSPQGLALYANLSPWLDRSTGRSGEPALYRSLDGGGTWAPLPVP